MIVEEEWSGSLTTLCQCLDNQNHCAGLVIIGQSQQQ